MCLTNKQKTPSILVNEIREFVKSSIKVAEKDIIVYKTMMPVRNQKGQKRKYVSFHQQFIYERGSEYYETGGMKISASLNENFIHIKVDEAFHSWATFKTAYRTKGYNTEIVKCKIPKGAKYIIGDDNDIASDRIVILGKCNKPKP